MGHSSVLISDTNAIADCRTDTPGETEDSLYTNLYLVEELARLRRQQFRLSGCAAHVFRSHLARKLYMSRRNKRTQWPIGRASPSCWHIASIRSSNMAQSQTVRAATAP